MMQNKPEKLNYDETDHVLSVHLSNRLGELDRQTPPTSEGAKFYQALRELFKLEVNPLDTNNLELDELGKASRISLNVAKKKKFLQPYVGYPIYNNPSDAYRFSWNVYERLYYGKLQDMRANFS